MMKVIYALLTLAGLTFSSYAAGADTNVVMLEGRPLYVSGTMDDAMLAQLRQQRWTMIEKIKFTSTGGLPEYSVDIAQLLARQHKPIVVHEICASACLGVLVIRSNLTIEDGTIVLMHNTPIGQALTTSDYPIISRTLGGWGDREERWFIENGVDPRLLLFAEAAMIPQCVYAPTDSAAVLDHLLTLSRFDAWAPKSEALAGMGIKAARRWHQDTASILKAMRTRYPKANLTRLRAADEPSIPGTTPLLAFLSKVHICLQGQLQRMP